MPHIEVKVEMSEFDIKDIIDDLENRMNSKYDKKHIKKFIKDYSDTPNNFEVVTLEDEMKLNHFIEIFNKYSLSEIEAALPK